MKGTRAVVGIAVLAGLLAMTGLHAQAQTGQITALRAVPAEVHPGENFLVSGGGFPPHTLETITLACPNWYQDYYQNTASLVGPLGALTDKKGQFVLFPFRAFPLHHVTTSTCLFYASVNGNPYGVDIPAAVRIVAPGQEIVRAATKPGVSVLPVPRLAHSGIGEDIHIRSWPGAMATATISYRGGPPMYRVTHLDWEGVSHILIQLPHVNKTVAVRVQVRVAVGSHTGNGTGKFTILH